MTRGFEILCDVFDVETIAEGRAIRELDRLQKAYGPARWRKMKGLARIRLADGATSIAEVHWYEGHGMSRKEFKIKRLVKEGR